MLFPHFLLGLQSDRFLRDEAKVVPLHNRQTTEEYKDMEGEDPLILILSCRWR